MRADTFASAKSRLLGYKVLVFCLLAQIAGGCQQPLTTVSGSITLDGRPLIIPSDARGTVVFQPDGGRGTMATGLLDAGGHFDLATGSSREVPPGKYYVTVSVAQLLEKSDQEEQRTRLITPVKYASGGDSGLAAEVKPGENKLNFNLSSAADEPAAGAGNAESGSSRAADKASKNSAGS
jgi:hypothetical protein